MFQFLQKIRERKQYYVYFVYVMILLVFITLTVTSYFVDTKLGTRFLYRPLGLSFMGLIFSTIIVFFAALVNVIHSTRTSIDWVFLILSIAVASYPYM
jgi:hypothetical protein